MCVTSPFGCAYLCASVTKSWPSFRRTESHRLGSPLDGQGLARGWEGPLRLSTHSSRPERSPRSSPALAWWKETCQYIHDLRHCWKEGKRAKRRKQEKRQSRWKLKKKKRNFWQCIGVDGEQCTGAQRQEVVTLYSGQGVRGNNESRRRLEIKREMIAEVILPPADFLPPCWRRRERRGGWAGEAEWAPRVNFISPLIFSTLSLISRASTDAAKIVLAHKPSPFSFQKNSSGSVLFHSLLCHCAHKWLSTAWCISKVNTGLCKFLFKLSFFWMCETASVGLDFICNSNITLTNAPLILSTLFLM